MDRPNPFTPSAPRFLPHSHSRSVSRSPTRPRLTDDILADLSPASTLEAFTSSLGKLKASIEAASPTQRAFGIRAALASKKIHEWVTELSGWPWPDSGSEGFENPAAKRRKLSNGTTGSYTNISHPDSIQHDRPPKGKDVFWGSLPAHEVRRCQTRIDEISQDMEDLDVEEIKSQVLDSHVLPRTRPSSSREQPAGLPAFSPYTRIDDFTAVVTATVLQALPSLSRLVRLMDIWSVRLAILCQVPHLMAASDNAETALKSGWKTIETKTPGTGSTDWTTSTKVGPALSQNDYEVMRGVLQDKVTDLGRRLDQMLDTLEGQQDTLPEEWLDRMEAIEQDYGEWVVTGERRVREAAWARETSQRQLLENPKTKIPEREPLSAASHDGKSLPELQSSMKAVEADPGMPYYPAMESSQQMARIQILTPVRENDKTADVLLSTPHRPESSVLSAISDPVISEPVTKDVVTPVDAPKVSLVERRPTSTDQSFADAVIASKPPEPYGATSSWILPEVPQVVSSRDSLPASILPQSDGAFGDITSYGNQTQSANPQPSPGKVQDEDRSVKKSAKGNQGMKIEGTSASDAPEPGYAAPASSQRPVLSMTANKPLPASQNPAYTTMSPLDNSPSLQNFADGPTPPLKVPRFGSGLANSLRREASSESYEVNSRELAKTVKAPKSPKVVETAKAAAISEEAKIPKAAEIPKASEIPKAVEVSTITETSEVAENSEMHRFLKTVETPKVADIPDMTEMPESIQTTTMVDSSKTIAINPMITDIPETAEPSNAVETPTTTIENSKEAETPMTADNPVTEKAVEAVEAVEAPTADEAPAIAELLNVVKTSEVLGTSDPVEAPLVAKVSKTVETQEKVEIPEETKSPIAGKVPKAVEVLKPADLALVFEDVKVVDIEPAEMSKAIGIPNTVQSFTSTQTPKTTGVAKSIAEIPEPASETQQVVPKISEANIQSPETYVKSAIPAIDISKTENEFRKVSLHIPQKTSETLKPAIKSPDKADNLTPTVELSTSLTERIIKAPQGTNTEFVTGPKTPETQASPGVPDTREVSPPVDLPSSPDGCPAEPIEAISPLKTATQKISRANLHITLPPSARDISSSNHLTPDAQPSKTGKGHARGPSTASAISAISGYATSEPSPELHEAEPAEYFRPASPPIMGHIEVPDASDVLTPTRATFVPAGSPTTKTSPTDMKSKTLSESAWDNPTLPVNRIRHKSLTSVESSEETQFKRERADSDASDSTFHGKRSSRASFVALSPGTPLQNERPRQLSVSSDTPSSINERLASSIRTPIKISTPASETKYGTPSAEEKSPISPISFSEESPSAGRIRTYSEANKYDSPRSPLPDLHVSKRRPSEMPVATSVGTESLYPDSPMTPGEPPVLINVDVSPTPGFSPSKVSDDQLQQQIREVLESIPTKIKLSSGPDVTVSSGQRIKKRLSLGFLTRPPSRAPTPSLTLAPAYAKNPRPRPQNGSPEIKLYHLSRSTGEAPIKLFVRLVGEHGERVMVRVGGGWADLGEYLKEYASHHGRRADKDGKVEVQSPRTVSTGSTASMSTIRNGSGNFSVSGRSSPISRPASSLERPMSSLFVRKTRKSVGEESRDQSLRSPSTPLPHAFRSSPSGPRQSETPPSARSVSRMEWTEEESSLGLAGPKGRKVDISAENAAWVESMKEKVRLASAEKEKKADLKEMDKVGGTKRLFKKSG